ncbi:hypothetical protein [Isoptericola aurantiacus]|uniref:hypothetical protein n=1 Tax=Isoptericola aurantiacus TaxID=3377839 RepID=UPI00383BE3D3
MLLVTGLLVGAGSAAGFGLGRAVDAVREAWPEPGPDLAADKAAPPAPLDPAGPAETCGPEAVSLELGSPSSTLVLGTSMPFTLRVTNVGIVPCLLDGDRTSMQVTVTDAEGDTRIWSSADCAESDEELLLLGPDDVWEATTTWTGARSEPGCKGAAKKLPAGHYVATLSLADVQADSEPFDVTVEAAPTPDPEPDAQGDDATGDESKGDAKDAGSEKGDGAKDDAKDAGSEKDGDAKSDGSSKDDGGSKGDGAKGGAADSAEPGQT